MCLHRTAAGFHMHSIAECKAPPSRTQYTRSMQHAGSPLADLVQRNDRPMAVCQGQVHARHLVLRHSHSSRMAASLACQRRSQHKRCPTVCGVHWYCKKERVLIHRRAQV